MAVYWDAKAPAEVRYYEWTPKVAEGDSVASYTLAISGTATIDAQTRNGDVIEVYIAGGADGETAILTATAVTDDGEELAETIYLPVRAATNAFAYTVRDVCNFALRKAVGNGGDPDATELDDATERLSDMLAAWADQGADLGVKLPCAANDVLYVSDAFASAIKNNLIVELADLYGAEIGPAVARNARVGLQQIKTGKLPAIRDGSDYF